MRNYIKRHGVVGLLLLFVCVRLAIHSRVSADTHYRDSGVQSFSSEKACFTIMFKEMLSSYRTIGIYLLPGETLTIEVAHGPDNASYEIFTTNREATRRAIKEVVLESP